MKQFAKVKGYESKKCFYCQSPIVRKNGFVKGVQLYKCYACGKQFPGGFRLDNAQLWKEYQEGRQTYAQLADRYGCSIKTIQRRLDKHVLKASALKARAVNVLMDTAYWGRNFGVMLFKDSLTGESLLKYYVKHETGAMYVKGVEELQEKGFTVQSIVCDGRKGLTQSFSGIPVQLCQFHQSAIIRRYLTKNPKLQAAKELMNAVNLMKQTDKESFTGALALWLGKWNSFLSERTVNPDTGKSFYTHKNLRSACRSLKNNLSWLFTWYDYPNLHIPNTTNAIDGRFADLKNKLRNHNGLNVKQKKKFIDGFLKA